MSPDCIKAELSKAHGLVGQRPVRFFFVEKVVKLESDLAQFAGMQCLNVNSNEI
jgi:hypothetical protein